MCLDLPFKGCVDFSFPVCAAVPRFLDNASTHFPGRFINLQFHGCHILKTFKILIRYLATSQSSHVSAEKLYTTISKQGILFLNYAKILGKYHMSLKNCCHSFNLFNPQPILSALWFDSDPLLRKTRLRSKFQNKIKKNLIFLLSCYILLVLAPRCSSQIFALICFRKGSIVFVMVWRNQWSSCS